MGGYYLLALFVFFLGVMLILFIKLLFAARKKPDEFAEREAKLLRLYSQIEDMMESFEDYVNVTQDSISAQKEAIFNEMNRMKDDMNTVVDNKKKEAQEPIFREFVPSKEPVRHKPAKKEVTSESVERETNLAMRSQGEGSKPRSGKTEEILAMRDEGKSENEIARSLGMTLSEVRLIIQVNK